MTLRQRILYALLLFAGTASLAAFFAWWLEPGHVADNFNGPEHIIDVALFAALTLVFGHRLFMDMLSWLIAWGIREPTRPLPPQAGLRVAFITTFVPSAEPLALLQRTLPAMLRADYPHDVWLLDEGGDAETKALCARLGVHYFTRKGIPAYNQPSGKYTARTKGGNHNAWYDAVGHRYDVVAQIDTDFIPHRDFLTRTLGYFRDPKVGWVGTPQIYGNRTASAAAHGAAQQQYAFYGPLLRGFGGREMCCMVGANHVVRVSALCEVDYYAGHLTEDLLTGLRLHAAGWRSHYVEEPLAVGEGPETWSAFFGQQERWAFGCMDILARHTLGLIRKMPLRQAAFYLALQQFYFSGVAAALGLALLCTYFFAGVTPAAVPLVPLIEWGAPLFLLRHLITLWLQRFYPPVWSEKGLLPWGRLSGSVIWPVYLMAFIGVLRGKRMAFKVTPKGGIGRRRSQQVTATAVAPHAAIGLLSVSMITSGVLLHRTAAPMLFWAGANVAIMLPFSLWTFTAGRRLPTPARTWTRLTIPGRPAAIRAHIVLRPRRPIPALGPATLEASVVPAAASGA